MLIQLTRGQLMALQSIVGEYVRQAHGASARCEALPTTFYNAVDQTETTDEEVLSVLLEEQPCRMMEDRGEYLFEDFLGDRYRLRPTNNPDTAPFVITLERRR